MNIKPTITIAIITYRRQDLLARCLKSICNQTLLPSKIIIIDNDPKKSSELVFKKFKNKIPITYFIETKKGAPNARNTAIKKTKTKYIGFIDDDCVLNKNWFKQVSLQIQKNNIAFIIGKSKLQNKNNVFAQCQFDYYKQWFNSQVNKKPLPPELFDTKNIIINCNIFKKNKFKFDGIFGNSSISGFEDIDMGRQFANQNFYGLYNPKMIIYHQELSSYPQMIEKSFQRGRLKYLLNHKWNILEIHSVNPIHKLLGIIKNVIKNPKKIITIILIESADYSFKLGYNYQKKHNQKTTNCIL